MANTARTTETRCTCGNATAAEVNAGKVILANDTARYVVVTDAWIRALGGTTAGVTTIDVVDSFVHKVTDSTTISATHPATDEATSYALSIELVGDHNTHTASTAYHKVATAAISTTAATTEATLIAQVNAMRTAQLAHYADVAAHGGIADATNLALVVATTPATTAATAITLENSLYTAHAAHLLVTTGQSKIATSWAIAAIARDVVARIGDANVTVTNTGGALTAGRGLWLKKGGADLTGATSVDYCISYILT